MAAPLFTRHLGSPLFSSALISTLTSGPVLHLLSVLSRCFLFLFCNNTAFLFRSGAPLLALFASGVMLGLSVCGKLLRSNWFRGGRPSCRRAHLPAALDGSAQHSDPELKVPGDRHTHTLTRPRPSQGNKQLVSCYATVQASARTTPGHSSLPLVHSFQTHETHPDGAGKTNGQVVKTRFMFFDGCVFLSISFDPSRRRDSLSSFVIQDDVATSASNPSRHYGLLHHFCCQCSPERIDVNAAPGRQRHRALRTTCGASRPLGAASR